MRRASRTLTDKAYTYLEELIVTLKLPPGSAVSEAMLSRRLRIGRFVAQRPCAQWPRILGRTTTSGRTPW